MENETRIEFMFQKRSLTTGFLVASLGIAAGLAVVSSPTVASADAGCGDLKHEKVKAVCGKGGKDAVKKAMKAAMDEANKGGAKLECKSCHSDQKEYKKSDNADADFKKHLDSHFK
jgi:hypothetical protein